MSNCPITFSYAQKRRIVAKIVSTRLTKICTATFASAERLPTSATLVCVEKISISVYVIITWSCDCDQMGPALIYIQSPCWQQASHTQHPHFSHPHPPPKKIIWMDHFQVYRVQIIYYVILDTWSIEYNKLRSHAFDVSSQMLGKIVLWPDWLGGFFVCYPVRFGQGEGEH